MFTLMDAPRYWWPLDVPQPDVTAPAGEVPNQRLEVLYEWADDDAVDALLAEVREHSLTDRQLAPRLVHDWRLVVGADGQPIAFSAQALQQALRQPGVARAIVRGFFLSRQKAAEGN